MKVLNLAQPSIADMLHELAVRLQPLVWQWHVIRRETAITPAERNTKLARLEREANRAGMVEMHRLLRHLCRQYCSARNVAWEGRFDVQAFEEEVLLLLHERLPQFEPQRGRFSTWLSNHVLQEVFSSLQRRVNPRWGRPAPVTERGRQQRRTALQLARAASAPRGTSSGGDPPPELLEGIADDRSGIGDGLLEQQCREQFLQAVDRLSAADQLLLERIFLRGEVKQDVARSMGRSPGRISQKLGEIKKRLAELLGPDFNDECGDTHFCCDAQCRRSREVEPKSAPGPQSAGAPAASDRRTAEDMAEAIPELLRRSGWTGSAGTVRPCSDPAEQALWDQLMARPVPPRDRRWWYLGAMAAGVGVVLLAGLARIAPTPSPSTVADAPPPPERPATRRPQADPPPKAAPRSPAAPTPRQTRKPQAVAERPAARPRPQNKPSVPPAAPRLPAPLIATGPERVVVRGDTDSTHRDYAATLCKALGELPPLPGADGPTVLEVPLSAAAGQVHLEKAPEVLISGGAEQDAALLGAVEALQAKGLPDWPDGTERTARYLLTFDSTEKQPLDCRPD
ncbi:sigma-70 family RNA polymerase sigma factor [Gloeobacter morelensis]|uniref:Sigma-70 family RNA polymerase sigma factor n=1 Tax=Gloeobacter morelensis MG652769 TaxID=2781736 RepID=A0ABY3PMM6_9CYAN|nr:sigma-70 family RNA polymerase sigma factor [Gloeobacter morelensis]UFP94833.1 sigma-70 family RNA polymerase sigma factor [Gloeobacter morelensis MG652769]